MHEVDEDLNIEQENGQKENAAKNKVPTLQTEGRKSVKMVPLGYLNCHHKMEDK